MLSWKRLSTTLLAIGAIAATSACGDNNTPGGPVDAADPIDGEDIPIDAGPDANLSPTTGGTLAVFDTTLTDPSAVALPGGVRGGTIRYSFNDLTMAGGEVVYGTSAINGCVVTKFDADSLPNPRQDGGPITVSGPATGDSALLKTVGPCTLQPGFGEPDPYVCISNNETGATVAAQDLASNSLVAYVFAAPTVDFGTSPPVTISTTTRETNVVTVVTAAAHGYVAGMTATVSGVADTGFNGRFTVTSTPTATSFTYSQTAADATSTGGTSTVPTGVIVGSAVVVNGFANTAFNSGASAFPVVAQLDRNTLIVLNSAPANGAAAAPATVNYTVVNGFSPVPAAGATANFLGGSAGPDDSTTTAFGSPASVRIQKASNGVWPAIDVTIDVPGEARRPVALTTAVRASNVVTATTAVAHDFVVDEVITIAGVADASFNTATATVTAVPTPTTFTYAQTAADATSTGGTGVRPGAFTLDPTSQLAHVFPTSTASDLKYSCDNATSATHDDTCGDEASAGLKAIIISGSATKKSVQGLFPFQMPTEIPGTDEWLEWQCAYILQKSAELPEEAVQEILDFAPTRIEMQVLFVAGTILDGEGTNVQTLRVLAGHALAGHQTFCPRAGTTITPANIASISRAGDVVTVTTTAPHGFVGGSVTIAGVTDTSFNGTFAITSTPIGNGVSTSFTYAQTAADATSTGGTATIPASISGLGTPVCP